MALTEKISEYIVNLDYQDLPKDVIEFTKVCILDWYGSAIAGIDEPPVVALKETLFEMGGNEQATLISGERTSLANAAMIHSAASHIVELDDIHKGSIIHAATVVIPAALSVCEAYDLSIEELITVSSSAMKFVIVSGKRLRLVIIIIGIILQHVALSEQQLQQRSY